MDKLEWLKERQKGIGGSDVGAILGVNKWKTPFQVYLEKTEEITEVGEQSEAAYWGTELEDMVAREFAKRTGKKVRRDTKHFRSKDYPFMVANIDRRVVGENAILECKTVNQYGAKEWDGDEIPPSYLLQVQHYLYVTESDKGYIAALIGGQRFVWKEIERDEELIEIIINSEKYFWSLVENKTPPALDGSSAAEKYINKRFSKGNSELEEVALSSNYEEMIKEYFSLKEQSKDLNLQIKEIENNIKLELGQAESGYINQYKVSWKTVKSNRVNAEKLKKEYKDIYESVIKETVSRRFEIKEDNNYGNKF